ncbi:MAG: CCDC90 family protein [Deltaproteobacteria bacterium]|jgi:hypothetical protein|nr:CCDC90 family protein [Deltaproteobacteria bacterium]
MTAITFDTLGYFEKLKAAGVPEEQAKVQVEAMQDIIKNYDEIPRNDLATKGDIHGTHLEIQSVRIEIQNVKHDILKWVFGIALGQTALIIAVFSFLLK